MILFDRPFQVGDKIQLGKHYGEVLNIGLRAVRIVTPDDSQVSIPNSEIVNQSVSNANSGENNCQVVAEFYLPPHIDLVKAKKIAYRAAAVSRYIYLNKPIAIIFKNEIYEGRSLLKMRLKAYVLDIRYEFPFSSEMTERVVSEFLKQGLVTPGDLAFVRLKPDLAIRRWRWKRGFTRRIMASGCWSGWKVGFAARAAARRELFPSSQRRLTLMRPSQRC
jgi:small-conductance mechanosensitive channel